MTKYLSLLGILFILASCGSDVKREDLLPPATGPHGMVILLMEDDLWNGPVGEAVMYHLDQNAKGPYLRPEPMFEVVRKKPEDLDHLSQLHRLILKVMIDFDSTYQETAIIEKPNYFAKGQLFMIIKDSDIDRLYSFVVNEFAYVVNKFNDFELNLLIDQYKKDPNRALKEIAEKNYGIDISVPADAEIRVDSSDFTWVKRERSRMVMGNETQSGGEVYWIQEGILIWSKPYTDTTQLTLAGALRDRDTMLKYHVPGKVEDSYMSTEYDPYYKPEGKIIKHEGAYAIEIRGLWKHAGNPAAFGGGPFIEYVLHNEKRQTVITVCIYIYGPNFDKREYIREGEAILKTIEFVE